MRRAERLIAILYRAAATLIHDLCVHIGVVDCRIFPLATIFKDAALRGKQNTLIKITLLCYTHSHI